MEKLFEVISSFIPDEQKDDIKSKIDGEVSAIIKDNSKVLKRELSSKYGVNLFEEDVTKAYTNDKFVAKDLLLEKDNELKTIREQFEQTSKEVETLRQDKERTEITYELLSNGLNKDRLDIVLPMLDGEGTLEEKITKVKTRVPEFFQQANNPNLIVKNIEPNRKPNDNKSDFMRFIEQNKAR